MVIWRSIAIICDSVSESGLNTTKMFKWRHHNESKINWFEWEEKREKKSERTECSKDRLFVCLCSYFYYNFACVHIFSLALIWFRVETDSNREMFVFLSFSFHIWTELLFETLLLSRSLWFRSDSVSFLSAQPLCLFNVVLQFSKVLWVLSVV